MTKYELGVQHHMKSRRLDNRTRIIEELAKEECRFEELLRRIGISRATLNSHLKQLLQEGKIRKLYSSTKNAIVYSVFPETLLREIIIHDFVNFIGSRVVEQILRIEMKEISKLDLKKAFPYGTVEDFVERRYKTKSPSYRTILDILKEEYGEWIEKEGIDDEF